MTTTIKKWGNSLALRIPKGLAAEARLVEGEEVELRRVQEGVLLRPQQKKRYRLSALVGGITRANRHAEISFGKTVGKEIW